MRYFLWINLLAQLFLHLLSDGSFASPRKAFLVGATEYPNLAQKYRLPNAVGDVDALATTLAELGFPESQLKRIKNPSITDFDLQWGAFLGELKKEDIVFIAFSGHGVEYDYQNYLLPSDFPGLKSDLNKHQAKSLFEKHAIFASKLIADVNNLPLEQRPRITIFLFDACRNNPLEQLGKKDLDLTGGLAKIEPKKGMIILYSAATKQLALDSLSRFQGDKLVWEDPIKMSVYTRNLLPLMKQPGLDLPLLAQQVRKAVEREALNVNHEQRPAYYDDLSGIDAPFCFAGCTVTDRQRLLELDRDRRVARCDELAAFSDDPDRKAEPVNFSRLSGQTAFDACSKALELAPGDHRIELQLARAEMKLKRLAEARSRLKRLADAGEATAYGLLGDSHETYVAGPDADWKKAAAFHLEAANRGSAAGYRNLGLILWDGKLGKKEPQEAVRLWRIAMQRGHIGAMNSLGWAHIEKQGVDQPSDQEAVRLFREASAKGDARATLNLGYQYSKGGGIEKNQAEALRHFRIAADRGDLLAHCALGDAYLVGAGIERDALQAIEHFRAALDAENGCGENGLGWQFASGSGVAKDDRKAVELYRKAAAKGNARGLMRLAYMLEHGRGVPSKQPDEALKLYRQAAADGDAVAMNNLAWLLERGFDKSLSDDVRKQRVMKLYLDAAKLGDVTAMINLGNHYSGTRSALIAKDLQQAEVWFGRAHDAGSKTVALDLVEHFIVGTVFPPDTRKARLWLEKAEKVVEGRAIFRVAEHYLSTDANLRSPQKVAEIIKQAADKGNVFAQIQYAAFQLVGGSGVAKNVDEAERALLSAVADANPTFLQMVGELYLGKFGAPTDMVKALNYLQRAADAGSAEAYANLGHFWRAGKGGTIDLIQAADNFESAVDKGHVVSMLDLAILLDEGKGRKRNSVAAAFWLYRAVVEGPESIVKVVLSDWTLWSTETRRALQQQLKEGGYYNGAIDGLAGPGVQAALQRLSQAAE
jgi:uncharacterized protein